MDLLEASKTAVWTAATLEQIEVDGLVGKSAALTAAHSVVHAGVLMVSWLVW